ncbi:MAG TPA: hypothetical protein VNU46_03795 [Gemmatimonadaceae bacterium]|jgi:hypothetical protein|nr:hypothetical protein [Gemmatimonadaceae bacterium]
MPDDPATEYDAFLEDLQSIVADRVEQLRARQSATPPAAFVDPAKVVRDWLELTGRVLEEFR